MKFYRSAPVGCTGSPLQLHDDPRFNFNALLSCREVTGLGLGAHLDHQGARPKRLCRNTIERTGNVLVPPSNLNKG